MEPGQKSKFGEFLAIKYACILGVTISNVLKSCQYNNGDSRMFFREKAHNTACKSGSVGCSWYRTDDRRG